MWWVPFLSGCFFGAIVAIFLFALIIVAEDSNHDRR